MITDTELAEIETRVNAQAMPPWTCVSEDQYTWLMSGATNIEYGDFGSVLSEGNELLYDPDEGGLQFDSEDLRSFLNFVAHARQDIPRLIDEVRQLLAVLGGEKCPA